jgi:hypothetical protein
VLEWLGRTVRHVRDRSNWLPQRGKSRIFRIATNGTHLAD